MSLKLVIQNLGNNSSIENVQIDYVHNASTFKNGLFDETSLTDKTNQGENLFFLGKSILGQGQTMSNYYDGYMSSIFSDSNGNFSTPIIITLQGKSMAFVEIYWDNTTKEYATNLSINGNTYTYNEYNNIIKIILAEASDTITIVINSWSKPNANCKIVAFSYGLDLNLDKDNGLLSLIRGSQSIDDNTQPTYSLIGGYGSANFYDNDYLIEYLVMNGYLSQEATASIYYNDEKIGKYLATNFKKTGQKVSLDLVDNIEKMQNINCDKILYNGNNPNLYDVFTSLNVKLNELPFTFDVSQELIDKMKSISISRNTFLKSASLWEQFEKIANILQLNISSNENGNLSFKDKVKHLDSPINIKTTNIVGTPSYNLVKNNIYKNPQIDYEYGFVNKQDEELNFNVNLFTQDSNIGIDKVPFYRPKNKDDYGQYIGSTPDLYSEGYYYNITTNKDEFEMIYIKENIPSSLYINSEVKNLVYLKVKISDSDKYYLINNLNNININYTNTVFSREYNNNNYTWASNNTITFEENQVQTLYVDNDLDNYDYVVRNINNLADKFKLIQSNGDLYFYIVIPMMTYIYENISDSGSYYSFVQRIKENITFKISQGNYYTSSGKTTLKYNTNNESDITLNSSELINKDIANNILQSVQRKYVNGLRSVNLTCFINNYYDTNGNLVYNKNGNDFFKVGDIVIPYELKGNNEFPIGTLGLVNPIKFKITSCELEYKGSNKLHLEMIEYKE